MNNDATPEMIVEKKPGLRATSLRSFLAFCFVLSLGAGAAVYLLNFDRLENHAIEVSHRVADSKASADQIQTLQELERQIDKDSGLIKKADSVFATSSNYQSQAIRDIRHYAGLAGIGVTSTTFNDNSADSTRSFTLSLSSPASYRSFLRFLMAVETNIPKMEVTQLHISRAQTGGDEISLENIRMVIHVR